MKYALLYYHSIRIIDRLQLVRLRIAVLFILASVLILNYEVIKQKVLIRWQLFARPLGFALLVV